MTNYHLKPPDNPRSDLAWQEKKEKRRKVSAAVGHRRAEMYRAVPSAWKFVNLEKYEL